MPTDMSQYPDNWDTEIRPLILERATDAQGIERCEQCGCENHRWIWYHPATNDLPHLWTQDDAQAIRWYGQARSENGYMVVLTIAHIHDPDPMNCSPDNLMALCQTCHNRFDMKMRQMNRIRNRISDNQLRLL